LLAETVTQRWRDKFATPLPYVGGGEFATNNIAVYSPDRPRAIVHADLGISPWIDPDDLKRRGAVLVWEDGQIDAAQLARLRSTIRDWRCASRSLCRARCSSRTLMCARCACT